MFIKIMEPSILEKRKKKGIYTVTTQVPAFFWSSEQATVIQIHRHKMGDIICTAESAQKNSPELLKSQFKA